MQLQRCAEPANTSRLQRCAVGDRLRRCVAESGEPCSACSGVTPLQYTLTLSGISLCVCANGHYEIAAIAGSVNTTYTLTQWIGNPCHWYCTRPEIIYEQRYWAIAGCAGPPMLTQQNSISVALFIHVDNPVLLIGPGALLFGARLPHLNCHLGWGPLANDPACGESFQARMALGYGGTATLVPV